MGGVPSPRKGRMEADWTAAGKRLLLAAEETIFSISPHHWRHLPQGHPPPPTTPNLLLTSSSPFPSSRSSLPS